MTLLARLRYRIRWASLKLHDKHHRILFDISWRGLQVYKLVFERWSDCEGRTGVRVFYDPAAISRQQKQEQCSKCSRFVPHACEVPNNPDRCMQADGPWDFACDEFYNPWKYQL